jgi:Protein of unknown function (DUF3455)
MYSSRPSVRTSITLLACLAVGCNTYDAPAAPDTPLPLRPSPGEHVVLRANARGVQIYECRAKKDDPAQSEWALQGPEAELFDTAGQKIGTHYATAAGPTWEAVDGSKVTGTVQARAEAPAVADIPWLRLAATQTRGSGVFTGVSSIQRVDTVGGQHPPGSPGVDRGQTLRVPYRAVYYFYSKKT